MRNLLLLMFIASLSIPSWSLLHFKPGTYQLEGYLQVDHQSQVSLVINRRTNSETQFILSGDKTKALVTKDFHKVMAKIKIDESSTSSIIQAQLLDIVKDLNGPKILRIYHTEKDLK